MPSSPEAPPTAPHVLLLIANDVTADTRVLKYAASLAGFGLRVIVLGIAGDAEGSETTVGGATVVRAGVVGAAVVRGLRVVVLSFRGTTSQ